MVIKPGQQNQQSVPAVSEDSDCKAIRIREPIKVQYWLLANAISCAITAI